VWFRIRQAIRGLLVPDEHGVAVAYMICEPGQPLLPDHDPQQSHASPD
jgi:hypothetical protein